MTKYTFDDFAYDMAEWMWDATRTFGAGLIAGGIVVLAGVALKR